MTLRVRVDRHKCIGAGNCITLAPTAFDWLAGDYGKSDVVGTDSVDEELLRAAAFSCPTAAIIDSPHVTGVPFGRRFMYGMTASARSVDNTKVKMNASFKNGNSEGFHQSYAISTSAVLPRELLHKL
jgi:ferredoxin